MNPNAPNMNFKKIWIDLIEFNKSLPSICLIKTPWHHKIIYRNSVIHFIECFMEVNKYSNCLSRL